MDGRDGEKELMRGLQDLYLVLVCLLSRIKTKTLMTTGFTRQVYRHLSAPFLSE